MAEASKRIAKDLVGKMCNVALQAEARRVTLREFSFTALLNADGQIPVR